jgi:hypothetical protein
VDKSIYFLFEMRKIFFMLIKLAKQATASDVELTWLCA